MKEQAEKLIAVEKELSQSKGPFELFALFLREEAPNRWDLVVSSDWARQDEKAAIDLLASKIRTVFTDQEMVMLSRLVVLDKDETSLNAVHNAMQIEHGLAELSDREFFGLAIKRAYLITSKKQA